MKRPSRTCTMSFPRDWLIEEFLSRFLIVSGIVSGADTFILPDGSLGPNNAGPCPVLRIEYLELGLKSSVGGVCGPEQDIYPSTGQRLCFGG